ncbi:MAG: winged helix-turn-helix transcriptional regulator, partial [Chloroflexi bacterium]|nr:winged helix-turn-helix transcriptional regulator [Chloroflexota bacterium]
MGQPKATDIVTLFKALADERRIKIIATLIDHGRSLDEIAAAVNLPRARVAGHLGVLQQVGLVEAAGQQVTRYHFRPGPLHDALRGMAEQPKQTDFGGDLTDYDQKVLGNYLVEGRLKAIP